MTGTFEKSIFDKSYNVKLHFAANGDVTIGLVMGFFDVSDNVYDFLPVSDDSVRAIAKALGITRSSRVVLNPVKSKRKSIQIKALKEM